MSRRLRSIVLSAAVLLGTLAAVPTASGAEADVQADKPKPPSGMAAGYAVFDRKANKTVVSDRQRTQFRSASLVKLLIGLDVLQTTGGKDKARLSSADSSRLKWMLRTSNDDAASHFWVNNGWEQIVVRWAKRLGLQDTEPPADRGMWGYTATSAADIVKVHRWILSSGPTARTKSVVRSYLNQANRCASDGSDQHFGIPQATTSKFAIKQGWSGFTSTCQKAAGSVSAHSDGIRTGQRSQLSTQAADIDLSRPAMHTSGTIGSDARWVVVNLTLEPKGTSWATSAKRISSLTKQAYLYGREQ